MASVDTSDTASSLVIRGVQTTAAPEQALFPDQLPADREGWEKVIDQQLIEWGNNPDQFEDDDLIAPSGVIIAVASKIACHMRDSRCPAPSRVVPDGEGGIAFERQDGSIFETVEIDAEGHVEWLEFFDSKLISRDRFE